MDDSKPSRASDSASASLAALRHWLAHALRQAVVELRPEALLGAAEVTPDGFYADFVVERQLSSEELPAIELRMRELLKAGFPRAVEPIQPADALRLFEGREQPYQRELAALAGESAIGVVHHGNAVQLCAAPERCAARSSVELADALEGFELRSLGGAYFRGDARNVMMSRIYAWAMPSKVELEAKRAEFEAAGLREHKKLGRELELFAFDDDIGGWARSEAILRDVLVRSELPFFEGPGEAAFYGPKIDFQFRMVTGREETASTLQLDFAMAERLDLSYVGPEGQPRRPLILHRAPLGTHERFVALLIERFGGAFPTWLAPIQARVLPVGEAYDDYAKQVERALRGLRVRADVDPSGPTLGKRIREAAVKKIPNVLVVGERELASRSVAVRRRGSEKQEVVPLVELQQRLRGAIDSRSLDA